jgi:hypothetical protein|tara:strand:+ start:31 stop:225 length:195 start_codon:yes stop_codon:yes gene_type:complete
MEHIKDILSRWWKKFKKDHIIDEMPPDRPFFEDEFDIKEQEILNELQSRNDDFEDDYENQPFAD